jgi:RNA polymerase-interacting CarD/CdnL/TRCF family regulator
MTNKTKDFLNTDLTIGDSVVFPHFGSFDVGTIEKIEEDKIHISSKLSNRFNFSKKTIKLDKDVIKIQAGSIDEICSVFRYDDKFREFDRDKQ